MIVGGGSKVLIISQLHPVIKGTLWHSCTPWTILVIDTKHTQFVRLCWRYLTRGRIWPLSQSSIRHSKMVLLLWDRASVSIFMLIAKQLNCWYHFCIVFGMTRSWFWLESGNSGVRSQHSTTRLSRRLLPMKTTDILIGFKLTPGRHTPITNPTRRRLRNDASLKHVNKKLLIDFKLITRQS